MELELIVEANASIVAEKQENGAGCRYVAATGWHHFPIERKRLMMSLGVARAPEEKSSRFHKFFMCSFDPLFESFVPTNLTGLEELDAILRPELGDVPAALLSIWFVPDRDVAAHKLGNLIIHHFLSFLFVSSQGHQSAEDADPRLLVPFLEYSLER